MCGIIGVVGSLPTQEKFKQASDTLSHRGPDDSGVWYDAQQNVALGHLRLSILDLSPLGHQPMSTSDGRYTLVFNGEIYNYLEIRSELEHKYTFKTKTDTEVLLYAYAEWKEKCLDKFNGMFAFAIWDRTEKKLFFARDRLGVKPFYYHVTKDGTFSFASEIKGLLPFLDKKKANEKIIFEYLAFGYYDHSDETFFDGILKLPAGSYGIWQNRKIQYKEYWNLENAKDKYSYESKEKIHEQFLEIFKDAIQLRFRSDVPVGVNISSGLDSNSLLAYAQEVTKHDLHLFSMCLPDETYNECQYIAPLLSDSQKTRWHTTTLQPPEVFPLAEQLLEVQDEPYGGIPSISYLKLNEQARKEGILVLLEGQGLDELLAGYQYYQTEFIRDLVLEKKYRKLYHFVKGKSGFQERWSTMKKMWAMYRADTGKQSQDATHHLSTTVLNPEFVKMFGGKRQTVFDTPFKAYLLNAQYRDIKYLKLPRVLRFNDHSSMAYGIELRLPYLDYRFVEFCFFLPVEYKRGFGKQKAIMRNVMKGKIHIDTQNKAKVPFGAVQPSWFRKYFKEEIMKILESPSFQARPYWDGQKVLQEAKEFFDGKGDNSFFLWQWVNLEQWLRKYID